MVSFFKKEQLVVKGLKNANNLYLENIALKKKIITSKFGYDKRKLRVIQSSNEIIKIIDRILRWINMNTDSHLIQNKNLVIDSLEKIKRLNSYFTQELQKEVCNRDALQSFLNSEISLFKEIVKKGKVENSLDFPNISYLKLPPTTLEKIKTILYRNQNFIKVNSGFLAILGLTSLNIDDPKVVLEMINQIHLGIKEGNVIFTIMMLGSGMFPICIEVLAILSDNDIKKYS
jgi:hypothetical protein